jgi:hypothetical protein
MRLRYAGSLLLALALCLPAAAEVKLKGEAVYEPHKKIVLRATDVTSAKAQFLWDVSGDADTVEAGDRLYVWAPPGKYTVRLTAIDFEAKKVERASFSFTVSGEPTPPPPVPGQVTVPDVVGQTGSKARAAVEALKLKAKVVGDEAAPVVSQSPAALAKVAAGSTVTLTTGGDPAPIPLAGLRVLIVEESKDRTKLPKAQYEQLFSKTLRDYLNANCTDDPQTGTKKAWWILDQNADAGQLAKHWQDALKRPRKGTPWVIVSNGKAGYEGPLPATLEETLALLKKYSEGK